MLELITACGLMLVGLLTGAGIFWFGLWVGNRSQGIVPPPPMAQRPIAVPPPETEAPDPDERRPLPFFKLFQPT